MTDRERLAALLQGDLWTREYGERKADAILAACEVRFREPDFLPADWDDARDLFTSRLQRAGWEALHYDAQRLYAAEARRNRLARDAEWNAAIEAALGVARVKCWSGEAKNAIRALKREAK